jgi:hypothetical protein
MSRDLLDCRTCIIQSSTVQYNTIQYNTIPVQSSPVCKSTPALPVFSPPHPMTSLCQPVDISMRIANRSDCPVLSCPVLPCQTWAVRHGSSQQPARSPICGESDLLPFRRETSRIEDCDNRFELDAVVALQSVSSVLARRPRWESGEVIRRYWYVRSTVLYYFLSCAVPVNGPRHCVAVVPNIQSPDRKSPLLPSASPLSSLIYFPRPSGAYDAL